MKELNIPKNLTSDKNNYQAKNLSSLDFFPLRPVMEKDQSKKDKCDNISSFFYHLFENNLFYHY
jgi:hypothetical protein